MWCAAPGINEPSSGVALLQHLYNDHPLNEIVRFLRIVRSEIQRIDFERIDQLCNEMIAFLNILSNATCVAAKRVRLSAAAIVAMHVTGRILPCITQPEGYQIVHSNLISRAVLPRRK